MNTATLVFSFAVVTESACSTLQPRGGVSPSDFPAAFSYAGGVIKNSAMSSFSQRIYKCFFPGEVD